MNIEDPRRFDRAEVTLYISSQRVFLLLVIAFLMGAIAALFVERAVGMLS